MILVEFTLDPGTDYYVWLDVCRKSMPWLDYLYKNCLGLTITDQLNYQTYQHLIRYRFDLDPKKETYYRMKYGNGI